MEKKNSHLHPSQMDVYLDQLLDIESPHYNVGGYIRLSGYLDKEILKRAVTSSIGVFDALRMRFDFTEEEPQCYFDETILHCQIEEIDFSDGEDPSDAAKKWMQDRFNTPFVLADGARLYEFFLIDTRTEYWFFLRYHHLITDGHGISIWLQYIAQKYRSLSVGEEMQVSYSRYEEAIARAAEYYRSEGYKRQGEYWKTKISQRPEKFLPARYKAKGEKRSGRYLLALDDRQRSLLNHLQTYANCSLQQLTVAALSIYFGKTTEQKEFTFGYPIHKRRNSSIRNMMGMVSGMLPVMGGYHPQVRLIDLIKKIASSQREGYRHQDYLLGDMNRQLNSSYYERQLFEVSINYALLDFSLDFGKDLQVTSYELSSEYGTDKLLLWWRDYGSQQPLELRIDFQYEHFSPEEIELFAQRIVYILEQFPAKIGEAIENIDVLPPGENKLLCSFNEQNVPYPDSKTVADLFEEQAARTPDAVAVVYEDQSLSYRELEERSNQLAHYLQNRGVREDVLVPICIERSLEMIVGILGILKAGGAYVPIDPENPADRIGYMLKDTEGKIVISSAKCRSRVESQTGITVVTLDTGWGSISQEEVNRVSRHAGPAHLAYVIYTSGSTGRPKGVQVEHRGLTNRLSWALDFFGLTAEDRIIQKTNYGFDVSVWELFCPLLSGGQVIFARPEGQKDHAYLKALIERHCITVAHFVPSMLEAFLWDVMAGECSSLRAAVCSGEALKASQALLCRDRLPAAQLYNLYGPTEATIDVSYWMMPKENPDVVPIGRPVWNTTLYVLDEQHQPLPVGVVGELWIGGVQLARGYLNQPEMTAERFIPDPFSSENGARLYRTGDLARWLPDGNVEYLGRIDDQVKVRGYRIELGEIESVLLASGLARQAVVLAKEDEKGNKRLVGYVVPGGTFDREGIVSHLQARLPEYMVPGIWMELKTLPLTQNGKVDKRALLARSSSDVQNSSIYAPARNAVEELLTWIWAELLGAERVGIHDSFFELGGNSLLATRLISIIRKELRLELTVKEVFTHPTVAGLAVHLWNNETNQVFPSIGIQLRPERIPLSFAQERIWFIDQLEGSVQYHIPEILHLRGDVDEGALQYAFRTIIHRHEALRTVVMDIKGHGFQHLLDADGWRLDKQDLRDKKDSLEIQEYIEKWIREPFDLSRDHMLKAHLIRAGHDHYILVVVLHHIASDGWSMGIIARELTELYNACKEDRPHRLKPLKVQYIDYALWQRQYLEGERLIKKLAYWKNRLRGIISLSLPTDHPRPPIQSTNGRVVTYIIDKNTTNKLKELAVQQRSSLYMVLLTAFKTLLYRYSGQTDICIGTPVAGRQQQSLEGMIGFFVNTLVIRSEISTNPSFIDLLRQVRDTTLEAYEHQDAPFEKVVEAVAKERDMSRSPLFQIMFALQNIPDAASPRLKGIESSPGSFEHTLVKFDLSVYATEGPSGISMKAEYCNDLFEEQTIVRMMGHFEQLLMSAVQDPGLPVSRLKMVGNEEKKGLLEIFNDTEIRYHEDLTMTGLFEGQVDRTPDNVAIVCGKRKITYRELNELSNQLAHYLRKRGVGKEVLVPVCMEKGIEMIAVLLAVMKAGGAYVPIDPAYPQHRIKYMLEDTGADVVMNDADIDWGEVFGQPTQSLNTDLNPHDLAYVIYTSGSTGTPKGVMIEHKGLVNLINWHLREYAVSSESRATSMAGTGFDAFGWEIWPYLSAGASVSIIKDNKNISIQELLDLCIGQQITHSFIPTALAGEFVKESGNKIMSLRYLLTGGDKLSAIDMKDKTYCLVNNYGPTENTVVTTRYSLSDGEHLIPAIGKPLDNVKIYILDNSMEPVPVGIPGQIYIGGTQLARGYLNLPDLTKERFIKDPFVDMPGARIYRSGDLGRWLADGNIEYLGRQDDQIKIRGYRIEPGEIENTMLESGLVKQAIIMAYEDMDGHKVLVGYIVPEANFDRQAVLAFLHDRLPEYMVPSLLIEMDAFPLTENGKIDRKALPEPDSALQANDIYQEPVTPTERILAGIWQESLGLDRVGLNDNYFLLGGDSIRSINLVHKIRTIFGKEIKLSDIYQASTLGQLAALIDTYTPAALQNDAVDAIKEQLLVLREEMLSRNPHADQIEDVYPMSDIQRGMTYSSMLDPGGSIYHDQILYRLSASVDAGIFEKALALIVRKHPILRTSFDTDIHSEGVQVVYKSVPIKVDHKETGYANEHDGSDYIRSYLENERKRPIEINKAPLWRMTLIRFSESVILVFQCHHSIIDGWSEASLNTELNNVYLRLLNGEEITLLAPLSCTYKDFVVQGIVEKRNNENREYWKKEMITYKRLDIFSGEPDFHELVVKYPLEHLNMLKRKTKEDNISLKALFLGAHIYMLHMLTSEDEVTIGLVTNNRPAIADGDKMLGCFLNTLPFRQSIDYDNSTWKQYFEGIESKLLDLKARERVSLLEISKIAGEHSPNGNPFFDTIFSFTNFHVYDGMDNLPSGSEDAEAIFIDIADNSSYATTNTYLDFSADLTADELSIVYLVRRKFASGKSLEDIHVYFDSVIRCYLDRYDENIQRGDVLSSQERYRLIEEFNDKEIAYPIDETLVDLFGSQVERAPDSVAVVFEGKSLTYRELNEWSNRFAAYLKDNYSIFPNDLVGIRLERSEWMIVSILGVLKSGGAYVPIDSEYPEERVKYIVEDSKCKALIDEDELERFRQQQDRYDKSNPGSTAKGDDLIYVIYTSGTTGNPKGVMIEHRSVYARMVYFKQYYNLDTDDNFIFYRSFSFDGSIEEYLLPLMIGAKCFVMPNDIKDDIVGNIVDGIEKNKITKVNLPPALLRELVRLSDADVVSRLSSLRHVISGGDKLDPKLVKDYFLKFGMTLYNVYGPTENTDDSTNWKVEREQANVLIPIGRPIPNSQAYILDDSRQILPVGVSGELYVSGPGISRGYLNNPSLTAERFILHPFKENEKMYRTGDVCRWLPDGNIEFIGRKDDQVKLRGYRIELGEIENLLQKCNLVKQAAVVARESNRGDQRLVAYVVAQDKFDREAILSYLQSRLPEFMIPRIMMELGELPLNSNGKVDKRALPDPDLTELLVQQYEAAGNTTEEVLVRIWEEVLQIGRIGVHDNFFELGGHSLLVTRTVSAIRNELKVEVAIKDIFIHPTIAQLARHLRGRTERALLPEIQVKAKPEKVPLSFAQERLWFIHQLEGSVHYHMPAVFRIKGHLNIDALQRSLQHIVRRHEALRTVIKSEDGQAWQKLLESDGWRMNIVNAAHHTGEGKELTAYIEELIRQPFDLSKDYMMRVHLIVLNDDDNVLVASLHHIAADGWSVSIIMKELVELYSAYSGRRSPLLPELSVQYQDYVLWQRQLFGEKLLADGLAYWQSRLESVEPLQLPTDRPRPGIQSTRGSFIECWMDKVLAEHLERLSRKQGVTLYMTLLAAFKVLLHRHSGQDDICVGSPIAGRRQQEVERLVGFFVNTLALRSDLGGDPSFIDLLQEIRETTLSAYGYQEIPFEKVVETVVKDRDTSRHPLFQVMFVLQNTPEVPELKLGDSLLRQVRTELDKTKFDITLSMTEVGTGLYAILEYCSDLFDKDTASRMMRHYEQLLWSIVKTPECKISELQMLTEDEEQLVLSVFNDTSEEYPDRTIAELFEEQVERAPDDVAAVYEGQQLTYRELNERSNQLGHYLRKKGVKEDVLVPICIARSIDMVVGVLGILKAGGAYVPLDPAYPEDRLNYMIDDTQAIVSVSSRSCAGVLRQDDGRVIVRIDEQWSEIAEESKENVRNNKGLQHLTYVIYTSGSTGRPKGVGLPERSLVNLLWWHEGNVDKNSGRKVLQFASINFDASFQEIFSALCFGGTIYLIDEQDRKDARIMLRTIEEYGINHLFIPYVVLKNLCESAHSESVYPSSLEAIFSGGEQLRLSEDIRRFSEKTCLRLLNYYGPSETHAVTSYEVAESDYLTRALPPIGKPVRNTVLYILGRNNELAGIGIPGELYIGGDQVGRGYWNKDDLTHARFIKNPFSDREGDRLYRTGDMARWLCDGTVEFMGRRDDQVKIRGNRVELGEVESVMGQCPSVRQCVVVTRNDEGVNSRLIGYMVAEGKFDQEAVLSYLKARLPEYMVPSLLIELKSMPITNNGKVNKRALPDIDLNKLFESRYVAPCNQTERVLADIWAELLNVSRVGILDNFFELGGHSLMATRVVAAINKQLHINIPIRALFEFQHIKDLAKYLQLELSAEPVNGETPAAYEVIDI